MTVATSPRPKPEAIPDHPGVYLFRDRDGRVIYVGKAISLRKRTASYFQPMRNLHPAPRPWSRPRPRWSGCSSSPRSRPSTRVQPDQAAPAPLQRPLPRRQVVPVAGRAPGRRDPPARVERGPKRKGTKYFGPYAHAYAIRETLDLLLHLPDADLLQGVFDRHRRLGRPCILFDINKCSGPCVGKVTPDEHRRIVEDFVTFMDGRTRPTLQRLEAEMRQAAEELNFELAARLRDQLGSVRKAMERQQMVSSTPEDFDIAAFAEDDLEAAVQVFFVRRGRVVGRRGFVVDKVEALDTASLAATFVQQLRRPGRRGPARGVPARPARGRRRSAGLAGRAARRAGRLPGAAPGEKRALLETVAANAREAFATHKLKRASDFDARARGLGAPGCPGPARGPAADRVLRHLQPPGQPRVVGSMVVFEDGLARRASTAASRSARSRARTTWPPCARS